MSMRRGPINIHIRIRMLISYFLEFEKRANSTLKTLKQFKVYVSKLITRNQFQKIANRKQ